MNELYPGDKVKILDKTKGGCNLREIQVDYRIDLKNTIQTIKTIKYFPRQIHVEFENINMGRWRGPFHFGLEDLQLIEEQFSLPEEDFII